MVNGGGGEQDDLPELVEISDDDGACEPVPDGTKTVVQERLKSRLTDVSVPDDVGPDWLKGEVSHSDIVRKATTPLATATQYKRDIRATATVDHTASEFSQWPRRVPELPNIPCPPSITTRLVRDIAAEARTADPNLPPGPMASAFLAELGAWREKLAEFFNLSKSNFPANPRAAADRIEARLSFLPEERRERIMKVIREGYKVPFKSTPPPFFRRANGPDLASNKDAAWKALKKDMAHGAVRPCNLKRDGRPSVVSPVRTAPKG